MHSRTADEGASAAPVAPAAPAAPAAYDRVPFFWSNQFGKGLRYPGNALRWDRQVVHGVTEGPDAKFTAYFVVADAAGRNLARSPAAASAAGGGGGGGGGSGGGSGVALLARMLVVMLVLLLRVVVVAAVALRLAMTAYLLRRTASCSQRALHSPVERTGVAKDAARPF